MSFAFLQDVNTPKGPGVFIALIGDGKYAQVSQWITRDGKQICVNPIYPIETITPRETTAVRKPKTQSNSQVTDTVLG